MIVINCIAVDDEPPALRQMKEYISKVAYLNLLATFDNAIDAMTFVQENPVDLIFLDIQMEYLSGIELLSLLNKKPRIILTTAYDSYALKAFELEVDDYLLKPISFERFVKATEKVYEILVRQKKTSLPEDSGKKKDGLYFFVKTKSRMQRVNADEILYIEGLKEYLIITLKEKQYYTLQSFQDILKKLPEANFARAHKSYIVALDKIDFIQKNKLIIGEKTIPIGATYKEALFKVIGSG